MSRGIFELAKTTHLAKLIRSINEGMNYIMIDPKSSSRLRSHESHLRLCFSFLFFFFFFFDEKTT